MKPAQLARYRTLLEQLRAEEMGAGFERIEPNRKDAATVGVADEDEQALSEMMQTLSSQRNKKRGEVLGQIARALARLNEAPDDFGTCEECEEDIPARRLELMPYVALCAECQARHDPTRGVRRKGLTDYR